MNKLYFHSPVDEIEVVLAVVVDRIRVCVEVAGAFGHHVLAVVGAEGYRPGALPFQFEQSVRGPIERTLVRRLLQGANFAPLNLFTYRVILAFSTADFNFRLIVVLDYSI